MELTSDFMEAEEELEHAPESVVVESELTPEFVAPGSELTADLRRSRSSRRTRCRTSC